MADLDTWVCKPCNWFAYETALKQQEKWGVQEKGNWRCPECKRQLTKENKK